MKIVFFNHYHNGDIHVSRGIIRQIMNKFSDIEFSYSHRNFPGLLADIDGLGFDSNAINNVKDSDGIVKYGDTIYWNTWYGQQHHKYLKQYGITFDSLYASFDDNCKALFGFSLNELGNINNMFPVINYDKFDIGKANEWVKDHQNLVLIDNGKVLSNQSVNFSFNPIVRELANKHKDKMFILTHKEDIILHNVFYTADIIGKNNCDLNEISFLSSFCDIVIGRASGAFTFSLTRENLFDRKMKFVCFSNLTFSQSNKFWIRELLQYRINYSAQFIVVNEYNINKVIYLIDNHL